MNSRTLLSFLLILFSCSLFAQEMDNPYILEEEWPNYSIGDPYILKHRGVFYLYCSTKDFNTGVKCWSSKDLVEWSYEGLCATDPITMGAYAPEVIYKDGTFYMFTSPGGNGHYLLAGPSPTGPFVPVSDNFGKTIDGSVFIDDDGSMYFYHASVEGIQGCTISDSLTLGESIPNVSMLDRWTEGPCVFKRNGTYYMIYTGNHLISKGYRIDYATSETGPLDMFQAARQQNPILLNALGRHVGLGHGSVFIGPDLDSYYLCYHNLLSSNGPFRRLNIDRIAWNDKKMYLLGPTTFAQQNPAMPDAYDHFERSEPGNAWHFPQGGDWQITEHGRLSQVEGMAGSSNWFTAIFDSISPGSFNAEFNLKLVEAEAPDSKYGIVFNYTDQSNYSIAVLNGINNTLDVSIMAEGSWGIPTAMPLPQGFDPLHWHSVRIERFADQDRFYLDGLFLDSLEQVSGGGKIGYLTSNCRADFSFLAFSGYSKGSGTFDIHKPIPGILPAIQYNSGGEGTGFHEAVPGTAGTPLIREDEAALLASTLGGYALEALEPGDWFRYNINVEQDHRYNIEITYSAQNDGARISFSTGGSDLSGAIELPATGGVQEWRTVLVKDLQFSKGNQSIRAEAVSGTFNLYEMKFVLADNGAFDHRFSFDDRYGTGWKYGDGNWLIDDGNAYIDGFGKRTFGSEYWRDYSVETDIRFTRSMNAGILLRANNPALGGAGDSPEAGTDFLQGYYVGFNFGAVILGKQNYNWERVAIAPFSSSMETWYRLRAVVEGDRIRVYVDDMQEPLIDYRDADPFVNGMAGLRSYNTGVRYNNLRITSSLLTSSVKGEGAEEPPEDLRIYPNPGQDLITILTGHEGPKEVRICDLKGKLIRVFTSDSSDIPLNVELFPTGIYLVSVSDDRGILHEKLIINR